MALVLFFLLFSSIAYAPKPMTSSTNAGLTIEIPKREAFKVNTTFKLHFHVYNSTNFIQTNKSAICLVHFYNASDNHILEQNATGDSNGYEFYVQINNTLVEKIGNYPVLIDCISKVANEAGWISDVYGITSDGFPFPSDYALTEVSETQSQTPLLFFVLFLAIGLMTLGIIIEKQWILHIDGYLMIIAGFWILTTGFSIIKTWSPI
jgi:hypothetical protein